MQGVYEMLPLLCDLLAVQEAAREIITMTVVIYLQRLSHYFRKYFRDDDMGMFDWVRNPLECN